jgi:hypothetical protein
MDDRVPCRRRAAPYYHTTPQDTSVIQRITLLLLLLIVMTMIGVFVPVSGGPISRTGAAITTIATGRSVE